MTVFPEPGVREESLLGCDADSLAQNAVVARCLWVRLNWSAATRSWIIVGVVGVSLQEGLGEDAPRRREMGEGVGERGQASSCREERRLGNTACTVAS